MNWIEAVKKIKKAKDDNRLVIFVGSGVSDNSGVPTWKGLIEVFADSIKYEGNCAQCKEKGSDCPKKNCANRWFTPEEYLRIPQYYYQQDDSEKHIDYYQLIKNTLNSSAKSNVIDDQIFDLLPQHIITTNFDSLLESSKVINVGLYKVIREDKDLLSNPSERYLIKMHGDLQYPQSITLKENDYLSYEQNHPLISTFIKSLLINHTFLFVGYSLNDNNLNLIINWIKYFCDEYEIKHPPMHFLLQGKEPSSFEEIRLQQRNIQTVALDTIDKETVEKMKVSTSIKKEIGKKTFTFLKLINEPKFLLTYIPFQEFLEQKYQMLKEYKKIPKDDFVEAYSFGGIEFKGSVIYIRDKKEYDKIVTLLQDKEGLIYDTFKRTGIVRVCGGEETFDLEEVSLDNFFNDYLENNYLKILSDLSKGKVNPELKVYYNKLLGGRCFDTNKLLEEVEIQTEKNFINIILHKVRARMSKISFLDRQLELAKEIDGLLYSPLPEYKDSIHFLKKLTDSMAEDNEKMREELEKQEERYRYDNSTWYSGHAFEHIWNIQGYVYDYYFFVKKNYIPMDYFYEMERYFSFYIRAILCSYQPVRKSRDNGFMIKTHLQHYPLGGIDLDIVVKYCKPKNLKKWLKAYSVQGLECTQDTDIVKKFANLCESLLCFELEKFNDFFYNYIIIFGLLKLSIEQYQDIYENIIKLIERLGNKGSNNILFIYEAIQWFVQYLDIEQYSKQNQKLLHLLIQPENYKIISERYNSQLQSFINKLAIYISDKDKSLIYEMFIAQEGKDKLTYAYKYRKFIPIQDLKILFKRSIKNINHRQIFDLLIEGILKYDLTIEDRLLNIIETDANEMVNGVSSYPNHFEMAIEELIILHLFEFSIDLMKIEKYKEHSEYLKFLLDPDGYDYQRVDLNHYMWQNLFYSKQYRAYFIKNRSKILTKDLEQIFAMGFSSIPQQKIVYGFLLNDEEIYPYGKS